MLCYWFLINFYKQTSNDINFVVEWLSISREEQNPKYKKVLNVKGLKHIWYVYIYISFFFVFVFSLQPGVIESRKIIFILFGLRLPENKRKVKSIICRYTHICIIAT